MTPSASQTGDCPEREWLENFADLAHLVAHEFNNFLNNMLLHLSVLELNSQEVRGNSEIENLRRAGREMGAKVRLFQQLSQQNRQPLQPVDVNAAVRKVVAGARALEPVAVHSELAAELPPVLATASDLERLVTMLLEAAAATVRRDGGRIIIRTRRTASHVQVWVQDNGPPVTEVELIHVFEPFATVRPGSDGLKLAMSRALVRRLLGNIRGENQVAGGFAVVVELHPAME
jgi:two-component system nitrogen regulation sensor histidine kinase NtrY